MSITLQEFIGQVIERGIAAAKRDYSPHRQRKELEGSIAGFEACRGKTPEELRQVLSDALRRMNEAHEARARDYWYWCCWWHEVNWVCNCVSAVLMNEGCETIITPTCLGVMNAHRILCGETMPHE